MAKRAHLRALPAHDRESAEKCQWLGARLPTSIVIEDGGKRYRPDAVIWAELPSGLVLGTRLVDPQEDAAALRDILAVVLQQPMAGPPRVPDLVRVASETDAALIRPALPPGTEIRVAPVPELDGLLQHLQGALRGEMQDASYFEDGNVSGATLATFFRAARDLYRSAPWKSADDATVLRIDVPELAVDGACISILGALEETLGIAAFASLEAYDAFVDVATAHEDSAQQDLESMDFGAPWTLLTFERAADVPEQMRAEVSSNGWPLASPRAYPLCLKHDRDGTPARLDDSELLFMSVCADAVAGFRKKHPTAFDDLASEQFDPDGIIMSHHGSGLPACTVTFPYDPEAWLDDELWDDDEDESLESDWEDDDLGAIDDPPARAEQAPPPGRNDPCPCGSGKKYKKCHAERDAADSRIRSTTNWIHQLDRGLLEEMSQFASETFGQEWAQTEPELHDPGLLRMLTPQWTCYHVPVRGRSVADWFLERVGKHIGPAERAWINAQKEAWLSLWEVRDVDPGRSLTLLDLLTGSERTVIETGASRTLPRRAVLLGRIVEHAGVAVISGLYPYPLAPFAAEGVLESARRKLRLRGDVPIERMRDVAVGRLLLRGWEDALRGAQDAAARPVDLHNTDGDAIISVVDEYEVETTATGEVAEHVATLDGIRSLDTTTEGRARRFELSAKGREGSGLETVVVAFVCLSGEGDELLVFANSVERADAVRARLASACGVLIRHRTRKLGAEADALLHGTGGADEADSNGNDAGAEGEEVFENVSAAIRAHKERHYHDWMDRELPALGGRTPRETCKTKTGRRAVDLLLREMECTEDAMPEAERYDFVVLRRLLALDR